MPHEPYPQNLKPCKLIQPFDIINDNSKKKEFFGQSSESITSNVAMGVDKNNEIGDDDDEDDLFVTNLFCQFILYNSQPQLRK